MRHMLKENYPQGSHCRTRKQNSFNKETLVAAWLCPPQNELPATVVIDFLSIFPDELKFLLLSRATFKRNLICLQNLQLRAGSYFLFFPPRILQLKSNTLLPLFMPYHYYWFKHCDFRTRLYWQMCNNLVIDTESMCFQNHNDFLSSFEPMCDLHVSHVYTLTLPNIMCAATSKVKNECLPLAIKSLLTSIQNFIISA